MSGDENKLKKYRFPETLTNQSRWFGLPLDELIPAAICVFIMFPIRVSGSGLNRTDTRIVIWNTVPV